eukprot:1391518-Rhodomonas_salina.1
MMIRMAYDRGFGIHTVNAIIENQMSASQKSSTVTPKRGMLPSSLVGIPGGYARTSKVTRGVSQTHFCHGPAARTRAGCASTKWIEDTAGVASRKDFCGTEHSNTHALSRSVLSVSPFWQHSSMPRISRASATPPFRAP